VSVTAAIAGTIALVVALAFAAHSREQSQSSPKSADHTDVPLDRIAAFAREQVKGLGNPAQYTVSVVEVSGTMAKQVLYGGDAQHATPSPVYVVVVRGNLVCHTCHYPNNTVPLLRGGPAIYVVDRSTLGVMDFYFFEPSSHPRNLAKLGEPIPVPVG
jgi:hypothetical protein